MKINRRNAMKTAAAAGVAASVGNSDKVAASVNPYWITPFSPPTGYQPDMTPGDTPVRLCSHRVGLRYPADGGKKAEALDNLSGAQASTRDMSLTGQVKNIRDKGFTACESGIPRYKDSPWLKITESELRELKAALKKYDVDFYGLHTTGSNIQANLEEREKCIRYTIKGAEAAEHLGLRNLTTHIGSVDSTPYYVHPDNWTMDTWKLGMDVFRRILRETSGMKVCLGIEATNMTIMNNPRAHLRMIEELGDPRVKVCLDPVNMTNLQWYHRNTELIEECFDLLSDHIIYAHAKDNYIEKKMSLYLTEVAPGRGVIDYEIYLVRLSRLETPCPLMLEHLPNDEEYAFAKKYLEDTAKKVGVKMYK
jgi:sugar phosphate isomerase/epimerase